MAKRQSVLRRSKQTENLVQRYLWPGTSRAWKDDHDVRGEDRDGWPLWGEVKNYGAVTTQAEGGAYAVLAKAYRQAEEAIERHPEEWPAEALRADCNPVPMRPMAFAVLWPKSCRREDAKLVMCVLPGRCDPVVMTLAQFRAWVVGVAEEAVA